MISTTNVSFKKLAILSLAVFGFCFWTGDSMAQSEHEKSEMENPKPFDRPLVENHSDLLNDDPLQNSDTPAAATVHQSVKTPIPSKKDLNVSGEGKKANPAPSTLSFNIFLYIVDKFKAD